MDIFLSIKGILVKDEIFNFVFSEFNNTQHLRLKFIDYAFAGVHYRYGSNLEDNFAAQIKQLLT